MRFITSIMATAIIAAAAPAAAQSGNASDVTGPITTGSTVANVGAPSGTAPVPTTVIAAQLDAAAYDIASQMSDASLSSPIAGPIPSLAQSHVLAVGIGVDPPGVLAAALGNSVEASSLANRVVGLLFSATPERLSAATDAFNTLIMAADAAYLSSPPAELLVIQAMLQELIGVAQQRS